MSLQFSSEPEIWDLIVIGAGPAGISAAINARARNLKVLVLENRSPLWKIRSIAWINNYPGFPHISGSDLSHHFGHHLSESGAQVRSARVLRLHPDDRIVHVVTDTMMLQAYAVVIAIGIIRATPISGEEEFIGRGVSYCTQCDGALFSGKPVAVVSYSPDGIDEANLLVGITSEITYIPLHDDDLTRLNPVISVVAGTPSAIEGDTTVQGLRVDDQLISVQGVFIIRDALPPAVLAEGLKVDTVHIHVDEQMRTNLPGIYAAGDCTGLPYQIAKAVGQGLIASMDASRRISRIKLSAGFSSGSKKEIEHGVNTS